MKRIPLTQGKFALVDDDLFDYLNQWKWNYHSGYATRDLRTIRMHRVIMNAQKGQVIDHINRDRLDNRRSNLRFVNVSQNNHNTSLRRDNTSGYKGIHFNKNKGIWTVRIQVENKRYYVGGYKTLEEAIMARTKAETAYLT